MAQHSLQRRLACADWQRGAMLLESLIAVLILAIGILGIIGLQATMVKTSVHAKYRAEAAYLGSQILGLMWTDQANLSSYAMTTSGCTVTSNTKCTAWRSSLTGLLPSGNAVITVNAATVSITINWQVQGEEQRKYELTAVISN